MPVCHSLRQRTRHMKTYVLICINTNRKKDMYLQHSQDNSLLQGLQVWKLTISLIWEFDLIQSYFIFESQILKEFIKYSSCLALQTNFILIKTKRVKDSKYLKTCYTSTLSHTSTVSAVGNYRFWHSFGGSLGKLIVAHYSWHKFCLTCSLTCYTDSIVWHEC